MGERRSLSVSGYSPGDLDDWTRIVESSASAHFLFHRAFMEYHSDRFEDASLVVRDGGEAIAVLPASRAGDEVVSHGGLTFGGVLIDETAGVSRIGAVIDAMFGHLREQGFRRVVYKPAPYFYHRFPADGDLYALFRLGAELVRRDVSATIALDCRTRRTKGRKAQLARAARLGVSVERSTDYRRYWRLLEEVLRQQHAASPTHSAEEIELLASRFPDHISLWIAALDGDLLGGVVVFRTPRVIHLQYVATSDKGRRCGAVDLLIQSLINGDHSGARWFDFGISTTEGGRTLNEGLARYKESFGARPTCYDWYSLAL